MLRAISLPISIVFFPAFLKDEWQIFSCENLKPLLIIKNNLTYSLQPRAITVISSHKKIKKIEDDVKFQVFKCSVSRARKCFCFETVSVLICAKTLLRQRVQIVILHDLMVKKLLHFYWELLIRLFYDRSNFFFFRNLNIFMAIIKKSSFLRTTKVEYWAQGVWERICSKEDTTDVKKEKNRILDFGHFFLEFSYL